jgi:hypothetical protein
MATYPCYICSVETEYDRAPTQEMVLCCASCADKVRGPMGCGEVNAPNRFSIDPCYGWHRPINALKAMAKLCPQCGELHP